VGGMAEILVVSTSINHRLLNNLVLNFVSL
jgi:hypothetical protein